MVKVGTQIECRILSKLFNQRHTNSSIDTRTECILWERHEWRSLTRPKVDWWWSSPDLAMLGIWNRSWNVVDRNWSTSNCRANDGDALETRSSYRWFYFEFLLRRWLEMRRKTITRLACRWPKHDVERIGSVTEIDDEDHHRDIRDAQQLESCHLKSRKRNIRLCLVNKHCLSQVRSGRILG